MYALSSLDPQSKYWSSLLRASLTKYVVHRNPSYICAEKGKLHLYSEEK